jgi:hypothetical protein
MREAPCIQVSAASNQAGLDFVSTLAIQLGLPTTDAHLLAQGERFATPSGLLCRLSMTQDEQGALAQIEMLLPVVALELAGAEVLRLLQIQAWALSEGWWLSATPDSTLQLSSIRWFTTPDETAVALQQLNLLGLDVVHGIVFGDDKAQEHAPQQEASP